MKKPKEEIDDQQWFNDQFKNALTRFDASHGPDVPELQQFEAFVDSHKQETKKKLLKELMLLWAAACFIFAVMVWMIDRNWVWFAILQAVVAATGIGYASLTFGLRKVRGWKS